MLSTFAVAGHWPAIPIWKGVRLYLELMDMKLPTGSSLGELFRVHKLHTVRLYNKCLCFISQRYVPNTKPPLVTDYPLLVTYPQI